MEDALSILTVGRLLVLGAALLGSSVSAAPVYQVLHSFGGPGGTYPNGDLQLDKSGNLYGTTRAGGKFASGTIFKLRTDGHFGVLYAFTGGADGRNPEGGLAIDRATRDLYGTTTAGGAHGHGGVFRLRAGELTVLHDFNPSTDGDQPIAALTRDEQGNLYGTTYQGGPIGGGTLFKVAPDGTFSVLHALAAKDGQESHGRLWLDGSDLYGVGTIGGSGSGTLFRAGTDGTFAVLHTFNWGVGLAGGLVRDGAGNLYGPHLCCENNGQIYALSPQGDLSTLYAFTGGADGRYPVGDLLLTHSGNIFGVTDRGGDADKGTIYKLDLHGTLTVLHSFAGAPQDGANASGGLIKGKDGKLYGITLRGGARDRGTIFSVTPR